MPLSENEQHLLEQMEQALYAEDPKFASQMQGSASRARLRRRILVGAVGLIAGLGLVFVGVSSVNLWFGALGFALMVGGAVYAITPAKAPNVKLGAVAQDGTVREHANAGKSGKSGKSGKQAKGSKSSKQSLMRRLEDRWDRRRHDQQ
ncbi:MAG: DUF3040 domain-containing protein [Actinomycetota bacterium]